MTTLDFQVRKDDLARTELHAEPDAPLADGQIRVQIDRFALTANNITYAAFGSAMHYWDFYPADDPVWGRIPVWGFGTVVQSLHPGVAVGEPLYGYFPMASHVVLSPARLTEAGFMDGAPHRAALHAVYNQVLRCNRDPFHRPGTEDVQALLRPLYITSWLIDDFLDDNAFFGTTAAPGVPGVMLLSSASSKTAWGTAFALAQRQGLEVVGLTSPGNVAYCESLGCYHRVLTYDQLDQIPALSPVVYVDFAGNAALRRAVHTRFENLAYSCSIGGTHVSELGGAKDLPGPKPALFFAPAQVKKRMGDWGAAEFGLRMVNAWHAFTAHVMNPVAPWLTVEHHDGPEAVQAAYAQVLGGRSDPRVGHILSLAPHGPDNRA